MSAVLRPLLLAAMLLAAAAPVVRAEPRDVRFEYEDGRVYVPVSLVRAGHDVPLGWFILDTGAEQVGFDVAVARRLGLAVTPTGTQTGAGSGAAAFGLAKSVPLRIDGVPLASGPIIVLPMDSLLAPSSGRTIAGIIGAPFFHAHAVELDRGRGRLRLDPPHLGEGGDLSPVGRIAVPFTLVGDLPRITGSLAIPGADSARTSLRLVVDLGAKAPLLLTGPLLERLGGERRLGPHVLASLGAGVGGETRYYWTRAGALRIGREAALVADSLVVGYSAFGTLASHEYDGLLGAPLLDHFAVLFDYASTRLWLAPRAAGVAAPEPLTAFDRAGMFLLAAHVGATQHVIVHRVVAGSPAAEAGIVVGDEVAAIAGRDVATLRLAAIRGILRERGTRDVRVTIRHGGIAREITLHLRDLV